MLFNNKNSYLDVIEGTVVSEKAQLLNNQKHNVIVINVNKRSNKKSIALAIKNLFGIVPLSVNILIRKGKNKRSLKFRGKSHQEKDIKRAYIHIRAEDFKKNSSMENVIKESQSINADNNSVDFSQVGGQ